MVMVATLSMVTRTRPQNHPGFKEENDQQHNDKYCEEDLHKPGSVHLCRPLASPHARKQPAHRLLSVLSAIPANP